MKKELAAAPTAPAQEIDALTDNNKRLAFHNRKLQQENAELKAENERLLQSLAGVGFEAAPTPPAQSECIIAPLYTRRPQSDKLRKAAEEVTRRINNYVSSRGELSFDEVWAMHELLRAALEGK